MIDIDLVEFSALSHDLGHPPFGHVGEGILDEIMRPYGGFEGNAQTLRVLCRLEKKLDSKEQLDDNGVPLVYLNGEDVRVGINATFRSIASVLKYDKVINKSRGDNDKIRKGYYESESPVVDKVKESIGFSSGGILRTIECSIMDLADDIAYSTYDLEDNLKAGFVDLPDMISQQPYFYEELSRLVTKAFKENSLHRNKRFNEKHMLKELEKFVQYFIFPNEDIKDLKNEESDDWYIKVAGSVEQTASQYSRSGYYRNFLSSQLVSWCVENVELHDEGEDNPIFWQVRLPESIQTRVETLKRFNFLIQIMSPRMRVVAYRGKEIVAKLFEVMANDPSLLPDDFREYYTLCPESDEERVICDYISCMTDRYAVELYGKITSENNKTFFSPH